MWTRWLADGVVILHVVFVAFVVLGGLLVVWRKIFLWIHPPAALWGFLVELRGWFCPLTELENHLRRQAGMAGYEGGFVEHYLIPVLYPSELTRTDQMVLALVVLIANAVIYTYAFIALKRRSYG